MKKTLRAGVIGLGVGERHAVGYEQHHGSELVVICDRDPAKLAEVAARHPEARTTTDPNDVFNDESVDVVSIASYDSAHYGHIVAALRGGKNVFVEKPLCVRREHAEHIRALLKESPNLKLSARFPCRLIPRFMEVKKLVQRGVFGKLYAIEGAYNYGRREKLTHGWRGIEPSYSIVLGGGVHIVDLLLWLTQQPIVSVVAYANHLALAQTSFKSHDYVKATVRFADGVIGDVTCNFGGVLPHFHGLRLDGDRATFISRVDFGELTVSPEISVPPQKIEAAYPGDKGKLDHQFSFIDAILDGGEPLISADQIFASLAVCFAIEEAVASGIERAALSL